jgi:hypothetical protein
MGPQARQSVNSAALPCGMREIAHPSRVSREREINESRSGDQTSENILALVIGQALRGPRLSTPVIQLAGGTGTAQSTGFVAGLVSVKLRA